MHTIFRFPWKSINERKIELVQIDALAAPDYKNSKLTRMKSLISARNKPEIFDSIGVLCILTI